MFVKPVRRLPDMDPALPAVLQIPDPALGDMLPAEGREVEDNAYWRRHLLDGSVKEASPPPEPPAPRGAATKE